MVLKGKWLILKKHVHVKRKIMNVIWDTSE
jgi:hypothetical protein